MNILVFESFENKIITFIIIISLSNLETGFV